MPTREVGAAGAAGLAGVAGVGVGVVVVAGLAGKGSVVIVVLLHHREEPIRVYLHYSGLQLEPDIKLSGVECGSEGIIPKGV